MAKTKKPAAKTKKKVATTKPTAATKPSAANKSTAANKATAANKPTAAKKSTAANKATANKPTATKKAAAANRPTATATKTAKKPTATNKSTAANKPTATKRPAGAKKQTAASTEAPSSTPTTRWVSSGADDDALTTAMNCERARDWPGAMAAYRRAIEHGGGSKFGARMQLMQAAYYGGDNATVLAMADELDGNAFGASLPGGLSAIFRARVCRLQNDWPAVAEAARTAIERVAANGGEINGGPVAVSRCEPQFLLGLAMLQLDPAHAAAPLEEATRLDPSHTESLDSLAWAYRGTERLAEAVAARKKLVALSENGDDYYNLACVLALTGATDEALAALAIAIERVPENRQLAPDDDDFASLVGLPRFTELITA